MPSSDLVEVAYGPDQIGPCEWDLPDLTDEPELWEDTDIVGSGASLDVSTVLNAYALGIFPMPVDSNLCWFSPEYRGVLPLDNFSISRSLKRSLRRYRVSSNRDFGAVIGTCASLERHGAWISEQICELYCELYERGWAHSVEVWDDDDVLVGGLYGLQIGGFFAGESMFHLSKDASKVALVALVELLCAAGVKLCDTQWQTDHLASLGVIEIPRADYLRRLSDALKSKAQSVASIARFKATEIGTKEYSYDFAQDLRWLPATPSLSAQEIS